MLSLVALGYFLDEQLYETHVHCFCSSVISASMLDLVMLSGAGSLTSERASLPQRVRSAPPLVFGDTFVDFAMPGMDTAVAVCCQLAPGSPMEAAEWKLLVFCCWSILYNYCR